MCLLILYIKVLGEERWKGSSFNDFESTFHAALGIFYLKKLPLSFPFFLVKVYSQLKKLVAHLIHLVWFGMVWFDSVLFLWA